MLKQQLIDVNFSGIAKSIGGNIQMQSSMDAFKKAILSCLFVWALGALFVIVPFAGWTMPFIFLAIGPFVGVFTYFSDRCSIHLMDASVVCPNCQSNVSIHETNFRPPSYGSCSNCGTAYEVNLRDRKLRKVLTGAQIGRF